MKLLVIGSGGREHAMAWKLAQSPKVQKVFVAPGNGGTATESGLENLALSDFSQLIDFCRKEQIHLTVVGPEAPLSAGIVDAFQEAGLRIFGPSRAAAQLELPQAVLVDEREDDHLRLSADQRARLQHGREHVERARGHAALRAWHPALRASSSKSTPCPHSASWR